MNLHPKAPRQPLYLEPQRPTRLRLDGPALIVQTEQQAERNLPLRRLSRIVAGPQVQIDTDVLIACARHGIVLLLHDDAPTPVVRLIGQAGRNGRLRQRLADLTARPDWRDHWRTWYRAQEQRITRTLAGRLQLPPGRPDQIRHRIDRLAIQLDGETSHRFARRVFMELSTAWMTEHLQQLGLGADSEAWLNDTVDLPIALGRLLALRLETIRLGWHRRRQHWQQRHHRTPDSPRRKDLVLQFENNATRIDRLGRDLSNRLHRWLVHIA